MLSLVVGKFTDVALHERKCGVCIDGGLPGDEFHYFIEYRFDTKEKKTLFSHYRRCPFSKHLEKFSISYSWLLYLCVLALCIAKNHMLIGDSNHS